MTVAERLMGIETEYAISGTRSWGAGVEPVDQGDLTKPFLPIHFQDISAGVEPVDQSDVINALMKAAQRNLVHLRDPGSGMYLGNGSRFYVDYGNHPELGTPECANPWDVVRYILAGERLLSDLTEEMKRIIPNTEVMLFKTNVDYGETWATWGCHESYLHRSAPGVLSDEIIPHLVTRIIYSGAGGFNSLSRGLEFTLSPRVPHLANVLSNNSTSDRGIFHTKDESLSKPGFHRLHVICGESLCSETAMWLKVATTALVVAMAEACLRPGHGVELRSPLQAMQIIASDPSCAASVETTTGRRLSAIEIQYHYLTLAEQNLDCSSFPPWAEEVCRAWRAMLNRLLEAPDSVVTTLDWAIKRALYANHAEGRGIAWDSLHHWSWVVGELRDSFDVYEDYLRPFTADFILDSHGPMRYAVEELTPYVEQNGLRWDALDSVLALRKEVFEIDTRFGQLGGNGIFAALDRAGVLTHNVLGVDAVDDAKVHPPASGRARIRGEVIRRLARQNAHFQCDWQGIADLSARRMLDLSNPFETEERWLEFDQAIASGAPAFMDVLCQSGAGVNATRWGG